MTVYQVVEVIDNVQILFRGVFSTKDIAEETIIRPIVDYCRHHNYDIPDYLVNEIEVK